MLSCIPLLPGAGREQVHLAGSCGTKELLKKKKKKRPRPRGFKSLSYLTISAARLVYQMLSCVWTCDTCTLGSPKKSRGTSSVASFQFWPKSESLGLHGANRMHNTHNWMQKKINNKLIFLLTKSEDKQVQSNFRSILIAKGWFQWQRTNWTNKILNS
jgi:hypothetical protein